MRLLCAISHHGLGHLAQAGPILNALHARRPDIDWLIWSGLPREALERRIGFAFDHRHEAADQGLLMHDAIRVDVAASRTALMAFHADWEARVAREADWLKAEGIAGVCADAAYLPLAAARRADLPAVAFCSLNWYDIAAAYLGQEADCAPLLAQMRAAYLDTPFLRLTPAMPMAWLRQGEDLPPVAMTGRRRREELNARLGLSPTTRVVLAGFGGIGYAGRAPQCEGVVWLVPEDWLSETPRPDVIGFAATGMAFPDLLASCDVLLTKSGYGSYVEGAASGVAVLHVERPDWPETPYLSAWLEAAARALPVRESEFPRLGEKVAAVLALPQKPAEAAEGAVRAAERILELLRVG
jgi:hypothetical protein